MMRSRYGAVLGTVVTLGLAAVAFTPSVKSTGPVVSLDSGMVRGTETAGVEGFRGIPYAQPPVGALRWRNPQPVTHWSGVKNTTAFGPACPQTDHVPQSEDCLTLNVWRPVTARPSAPLPVMVWIYGGALVHGSTAMYPGDVLARQGVVMVSMNYRMGRLGFFAHPALVKESPGQPVGNYGYMDQLAALKWVQHNIHAFGGDPSQVTIFGESAGGGSVMAHMVSPLSRGLFQRAILQSPGIPTARADVLPLTPLRNAERRAVDYVHSLGIDGTDDRALAKLRALPAGKLVEGTDSTAVLAGLSGGKQVPGISGSILDGRFLTETPDAAFAAGHQAKVPVIVGANDRDLAIGQAASKAALFAQFGALAPEARKLYDPHGDQSLAELEQQVFADRTLVEPSRHLADQAAKARQPVWWYRFSYVAESERAKQKGTLHGFEIPYALDLPSALVGDKVTTADKSMATLASGYWVSFGRSGDPNGSGRPAWPRHDPAVNRMINFTDRGTVIGPDPLKARLDLWQRFWANHDAGR
ncbi:carboxylesterase/lipase family protein [Streptomyces aureus]|uniref:carboxylesterase/lipase family protein n=1 Tax=Streptomyces aureus TaxID=193461 RepID=UPI0031D99EB7